MKRSFSVRAFSFVAALLLFVSSIPPIELYAGAPTWCKVYIKQGEVVHPSGCTVCTLQLILQNSATLSGTWQLDGRVPSRSFKDGSPYDLFDRECTYEPGTREGISQSDTGGSGTLSNKTSDSVRSSGFVSLAGRICNSDVTWQMMSGSASADGQNASFYNSGSTVIGLGNKDFKDMSNQEVIASMKAFWNAGFWCAVGLKYVGQSGSSVGPSVYGGNHWAMLAGMDDSDVYFNDPALGKITSLSNSGWGKTYKIVHMVIFKNNKTTPASVSGGNVQFSQGDYSSLTGMGMSNQVVNGLASGNQLTSITFSDSLFASTRLTEANLEDLLDIVGTDNMDQDDLEVLEGWRDNIDGNKKENGFIAVLRWVVQLVGILITIWALLIYLAFWFDHINSFVYLDALHILTLGQLHICPPGEKPTFHLGKDAKDKTVSHWQIVCICITAIVFGAMLISGVFYTMVTKLVRLVTRFISGG